MRKIISIILMTLTILSGCTNQSTYIEDIEALKEENLALKKDVEYLKNDFLKLESELNDTSENYNALTVDLENQFDSIFELRMKLDAYWMTYTTADEFIKAYCTNNVAVMEQYLNFNVSISDDKIVVDYTDVYQDEKLVNLINEFPIVSSDMQVEYQFLGIDYRVDQASITHIYRIYKQIGINQYIYELSIGINPEGKVWYFLVYG